MKGMDIKRLDFWYRFKKNLRHVFIHKGKIRPINASITSFPTKE